MNKLTYKEKSELYLKLDTIVNKIKQHEGALTDLKAEEREILSVLGIKRAKKERKKSTSPEKILEIRGAILGCYDRFPEAEMPIAAIISKVKNDLSMEDGGDVKEQIHFLAETKKLKHNGHRGVGSCYSLSRSE